MLHIITKVQNGTFLANTSHLQISTYFIYGFFFFKVPHYTTQSFKLRGEKIMHKISVEPPSTLSPSFFRATPQKVRGAAKRSLQYAEEAFSKSSLSAAFFPPPMASNILILRAHSNINLQDMRRLILYVPSTIELSTFSTRYLMGLNF